MKILIINGPNLNLLGIREPEIYGYASFDHYFEQLQKQFKTFEGIDLEYFQSNHEGDIIDKIQEAFFNNYDGILLNAGGFTHTSVAIHDAIKSVSIPIIEVHISNINAREDYRKNSIISDACIGSVCGFGLNSYKIALEYFSILNNEKK